MLKMLYSKTVVFYKWIMHYLYLYILSMLTHTLVFSTVYSPGFLDLAVLLHYIALLYMTV